MSESPTKDLLLAPCHTCGKPWQAIKMDAVSTYLVRALLRERDEWRQNYWNHLEQCAAVSASGS